MSIYMCDEFALNPNQLYPHPNPPRIYSDWVGVGWVPVDWSVITIPNGWAVDRTCIVK